MGRGKALRALLVYTLVSGVLLACGPESVECDGFTCPSGQVCDNENSRCLMDGQQQACVNLADDDDCIFNGNGVCDNGACIVATCGDELVEPGEMCDDGNRVSGDGCSDDCKSNEECGNGVFDFLEGEACEDGNLLSHDRCSSACKEELPTWAAPEAFLSGSAQMVYDTARNHLVLLGRNNAGLLQIWYDLPDLGWLVGPSLPPSLVSPLMVFDESRGSTVVVSGTQTWTLDDRGWRQLPVVDPLPRSVGSIAYDSLRETVVAVLRGEDDDDPSEVWALKEGTWSALPPSTPGPLSLAGARATFDKNIGKTVLVGDSIDGELETWFFSLADNSWEQGPSPTFDRGGYTLTFTGGRVDLIGGSNPVGTGLSDHWFLQGGAWVKDMIELPVGVRGRRFHAAAYNPNEDSLVLVGGLGTGGIFGDIWRRDTTGGWTGTNHPTPDDAIFGELAAYDPVKGIVRFNQNFALTDTWVWNGSLWQTAADIEAPPSSNTSAQASSALAFDWSREKMVLVVPPKTYFLEESGWEEQTDLGQIPVGNLSSFLSYDHFEEQLVLTFVKVKTGGAPPEVPETWVLRDQGTWTKLPTTSLLPEVRFAMSYFPPLNGIILVGQTSRKTWLMANNQWQDLNIPVGSVTLAGMAYDERTGLLVLDGNSGSTTNRTYLFNGSDWTSQSTVGSTGFFSRHRRLVYDQRHGEVVQIRSQLTFLYNYSDGSPEEYCRDNGDADGDGLAGCADPDCYGFCDPGCDPIMMSCPR